MNIASFITPAANSKNWLDAEIHFPFDVSIWRWKWLGLLVIAGANIPMDDSTSWKVGSVFTPLLGCFIFACWHRSSVVLKAGIAFGAGFAVFLHRELPVPGMGYGFFQWIGHAVMPENHAKWLLVSLALNAVLPMLMVVFFHYLMLAAEFLDVALRRVRHLLFDFPGATDRFPSVTQDRVDISS